MQKLGILASVLLLASVIIGPIGFSYAQTVDTAKAARANHDEVKASTEQAKADRFAAQVQKAADIKAAMNAKKAAAAKEIAAAIAARGTTVQKEDIPHVGDELAKIKEMAKAQSDARKSTGGPSKVQKALEGDRAAFAEKVAEYRKAIPTTPDKDIKTVKDSKHERVKTLKAANASDQLSKEEMLKAEEAKAVAKRDKTYTTLDYNKNRK